MREPLGHIPMAFQGSYAAGAGYALRLDASQEPVPVLLALSIASGCAAGAVTNIRAACWIITQKKALRSQRAIIKPANSRDILRLYQRRCGLARNLRLTN